MRLMDFASAFSPYITDSNYSGTNGREYQISKGRFTATPMRPHANQLPYQLTAWVPARRHLPTMGQSIWYSCFRSTIREWGRSQEYSVNRTGAISSTWPTDDPGWPYSWQGYFNRHSLAGLSLMARKRCPLLEMVIMRTSATTGPPPVPPKTSVRGLQRALATFALPGRPVPECE